MTLNQHVGTEASSYRRHTSFSAKFALQLRSEPLSGLLKPHVAPYNSFSILGPCSAGIGRTGLFMAYLAKRCLGLSGAEALQWVRHFIPRAVETPAQQRLVLDDE